MPPTDKRPSKLKAAKPARRHDGSTDGSSRSVSTLKKRKRDLRRLLEHSGKLPADVRVRYERELVACDADIAAASEHADRSRMIKKYHMVRFFERRKAERYLKKARQRLLDCEDPAQVDELKQYVHLCDVDLNYTLYYPLNEAYSSLYKKDAKDDAAGLPEVNRSSPMWIVVEAAMAQNQLQALREGNMTKSQKNKPETISAQKRLASTTSTSKVQATKEPKTQPAAQKHKGKSQAASVRTPAAETGKVQGHRGAAKDDDDDDQTGSGFFE